MIMTWEMNRVFKMGFPCYHVEVFIPLTGVSKVYVSDVDVVVP